MNKFNIQGRKTTGRRWNLLFFFHFHMYLEVLLNIDKYLPSLPDDSSSHPSTTRLTPYTTEYPIGLPSQAVVRPICPNLVSLFCPDLYFYTLSGGKSNTTQVCSVHSSGSHSVILHVSQLPSL